MRLPGVARAWRLLAAVLIGAALGAVPVLIQASRTLDFDAHQRNIDTLRRMHTLDADIDQAVIALRHGHIASYDPLVEAVAGLRVASAAIDFAVYRADLEGRARLEQHEVALDASIARKALAVESFKSQNAALRNSLAYLPAVADELLGARASSLAGEAVADQVRGVLEGVLLSGLDASGARGAEVTRHLARLGTLRAGLAAERADAGVLQAIDALGAHAGLIIRQQAVVDGLVATVLAEPVRARIADLEQALGQSANRLIIRAERYRQGLVVLVAVLVVAGIAAALRVWVMAHRLDRTVRALEAQREALMLARDKAQAASRAKATFLANMSHELRTPLNAITGYSELMIEEQGGRGEPALIADLGRIRDAGGRLLALVDDVLELARIEAGRAEPTIATIDAAGLLERLAAEHRAAIEANGNRLVVALADELGEVSSDPGKLRQAVANLLANAGQFTRGGTVTLRAAPERDTGRDWLLVAVEDTGIGMSEPQIAAALDAFEGLVPTAGREGRSGLGLAIVRRLAEQLGGRLEVVSAPGVGTTASLRVRADLAVSLASEAPSAEPDAALPTILLVDDDPEIQAVIGAELEAAGFKVVGAASGEEGIARARELRPDAVLLDVVMPGMDGWTVLRTLKADPELAAIPVVLLTIMENAELGLALGAAAYLRKPVPGVEIAATIRRHTGTPSRDVLVVDDDPRARDMVGRILRRQGVRVAEAEDGAAALRWLERNPPPAVMILDLAMPEPDGFAIVGRLAADARWRDIPVIVLTAKDLSPREVGALSGHVRRIFQKGRMERGELVRMVQEQLRDGRRTG